MKIILIIIVISSILFSCSKSDEINEGFVKYLIENKENLFMYLVNEVATRDFDNLYREYGKYKENIFDEEGEYIIDYSIPLNNKILGHYKIRNNFEETFFRYVILEETGIQIGLNISKVEVKKESIGNEINFLITCVLDSDGDKLFHKFTSKNVGKDIAIVFDEKIIVYVMIQRPLNNSINFSIRE